MDQRMVVSEEEAYELLAHLVASAEICTFEPCYYGTFRLIDAASRLMECMLEHSQGNPSDNQWLTSFKQEVDQKKGWMMWDREGYFQFLKEATGKVAEELKHRSAQANAEMTPVEKG